MPPGKGRVISLKLGAMILEVWLDYARIVCTHLWNIRGEQGPLRFTARQRNVPHVPLKLTAIDPGTTEGASAYRIFLERCAATRTMQSCGLCRGRRQDIAFALKF